MADLNKEILRLKALKKKWNDERLKVPGSDEARGQSAKELNNLKNIFASLDKEIDTLFENTIMSLERMNITMEATDRKIEENIRSLQ